MTKFQTFVTSIGTGIAMSCLYGIVHDQVSIRIPPVYLMNWHPTIIASRDPILVALAWGIVATWWFGLVLGTVLALAATGGARPSAEWARIVRAMEAVFVVSAVAAGTALFVTRTFGLTMPNLFGSVYADLDPDERLAFIQVAAMHETSYIVAAVTSVVAAIWLWRGRNSLAITHNPSHRQ